LQGGNAGLLTAIKTLGFKQQLGNPKAQKDLQQIAEQHGKSADFSRTLALWDVVVAQLMRQFWPSLVTVSMGGSKY